MKVARRAEISLIGKIRSLSHLKRVDRFRHQPIQVSIALTVGVSAHVDRHAVDVDRQVGAVIQVVATQEILVGFTFAAVLRDNQTGNSLQDFTRAGHRTRVQLGPGYGYLACHVRLTLRARSHIGGAGHRRGRPA